MSNNQCNGRPARPAAGKKVSMMNSAAVSVCAWCVHQLDGILRIASFTDVGLYADL
jgi:hypothetical protein